MLSEQSSRGVLNTTLPYYRKLRKFKETLLEDLQDADYTQTYLLVALEEYEKDKDVSSFLTAFLKKINE